MSFSEIPLKPKQNWPKWKLFIRI